MGFRSVETTNLPYVKYHVNAILLEIRNNASINGLWTRTIEDLMDRLFAGRTVNAAEAGNGPPLILFHSLLSDRASFDRIIPDLAKSFRVVVPELPGFGASHAVAGGLPAIADRMAQVVGEVSGGEEAIVIGNGYGGFVALQMVIRHPTIAKRLVLADCGAVFSEPGRQAFRNMAAASFENGLQAVSDVAMRRLFSAEFQNANPDLLMDRRAAFLQTNPDVFRSACMALAELDLRPDLHAVRLPVLVLVGDQDEATPPSMSYELRAGLPDASMVVLAGCAHVPQLQSPDEFLKAIDDFLQRGIIVEGAVQLIRAG